MRLQAKKKPPEENGLCQVKHVLFSYIHYCDVAVVYSLWRISSSNHE